MGEGERGAELDGMRSLPMTVYSLENDFDRAMRRVDGFAGVVRKWAIWMVSLTGVLGRSVAWEGVIIASRAREASFDLRFW